MRIQVWDYRREYSSLRDDILKAVDDVFSSGQLILGKHVSDFENIFSSYCSSEYGVGVNSGTDAIFLSLKALGIGVGDEVITVANTAVPTISAIVSAGASPRFVDIDAKTYLMDIDQVEAAITQKTKCILPVHLYGQSVDMAGLNKIAEKYKIPVLEDCAQSSGALYNGEKVGGLGTLSAHSFYPTKNLGAYGDGGMIVTSNLSLRDRLYSLRMYGMKGSYYAKEHGYNSRLDEVQAAILLIKMKYLDEWIERRREIAGIYEDFLSDLDLRLPVEALGNKHSYYVYVVRHSQRDFILQELRKKDIHCNISYPYPIHTMTGYPEFSALSVQLPETESAAKEIFSLPMYPTIEMQEIEKVCETLRDILK